MIIAWGYLHAIKKVEVKMDRYLRKIVKVRVAMWPGVFKNIYIYMFIQIRNIQYHIFFASQSYSYL